MARVLPVQPSLGQPIFTSSSAQSSHLPPQKRRLHPSPSDPRCVVAAEFGSLPAPLASPAKRDAVDGRRLVACRPVLFLPHRPPQRLVSHPPPLPCDRTARRCRPAGTRWLPRPPLLSPSVRLAIVDGLLGRGDAPPRPAAARPLPPRPTGSSPAAGAQSSALPPLEECLLDWRTVERRSIQAVFCC